MILQDFPKSPISYVEYRNANDMDLLSTLLPVREELFDEILIISDTKLI